MSDWTTEATDVIERSVALVRDRTVEPARVATKAIVYGVLAVLAALPAIVLATIGAFRGARHHRTGQHLGGLAHPRRNLPDRRGVLLDQAQSLIHLRPERTPHP